MPARPRVGAPSYYQQQVPGQEATTAQVVKTHQTKCVPFRCFKNVVVILEGGEEYKYYAPGVGGIRTEPRSSGGADETEDLINVRQLGARGLAEVSAEVLKLDRHARTTMPAAFGGAPAAIGSPERAPPARSARRSSCGSTASRRPSARARARRTSSTGRPRARSRRDDEPRRALGQRQVDADLGARGPPAARRGQGGVRRVRPGRARRCRARATAREPDRRRAPARQPHPVSHRVRERRAGDRDRRRQKRRARAPATCSPSSASGGGSTTARALSGGEAQRVAVAVALANEPDLLLAGRGDGRARQLDRRAGHGRDLRGLAERGLTVLYVTHSDELAARAQRRLGLSDGAVHPL